mgnify:CR=1 FL=1
MPAPRKDRELFSHLGPRLQALLDFKGIKYLPVAVLLNCNQTMIAHICDGRKLLPANKLPDLAAFLGVTPEHPLGQTAIMRTKTLYLPPKL